MNQQEALKTDYFDTIVKNGEGIYKEKGSKFIGFSFAVSSVEEAEERLKELKSRYHDARHACYAYRLNPAQPEIRANDDGEPNNSAGMPIFNQLQSFDLWNSLVVVIRYFGGTKLGVSGLVQAYKEAARLALEDSKISTEYITRRIRIRFPYSLINEVMRLIKDNEVELVSDNMTDTAAYTLAVRENDYQSFVRKLNAYHLVEIY